jgi:hypothetical protein
MAKARKSKPTAKSTAGHWEPNLFYNPERERHRLVEEAWTGRRSQLPQEPLIWVATPQGKAGRRPSLTAGQVRRGKALLRKQLRNGPHAFASKIAAVQWLRKPEQGLRIAPGISDKTVVRHIVNPVWSKKRKQKRTK